MSEVVLSPLQDDIVNEFKDTDNNILVQAAAGSGKSFTIIQMLKRTGRKSLLLAFNKSIEQELSKKTANMGHVTCKTMHGLAFGALLSHFGGNIKLNDNRIFDICKGLNKKWKIPFKKFIPKAMLIKQLATLYRSNMAESMEELREVANGLALDYEEKDLEYTMEVLDIIFEANKRPKEIEFVDMVYIAATTPGIDFKRGFREVFVDEAQDLSRLQHMIIKKIVNQNKARVVFVGDPHQSIYYFAGSDSASFDVCKTYEPVTELPLSVCYRCGTRIIDHARKIYPTIEPYLENEPGTVRVGEVDEIREGDMVICRNTKPLINLFFELLANGEKGYVLGKDLGKGLTSIMKPFKDEHKVSMLSGLEEKLRKKSVELKDRGIDNPSSHPGYISLVDKIDTIKVVAKKFDYATEIISYIESIFTDSGKGVVLCTGHKSKGLENERVFFLDSHLIPSKYAVTEEMLTQEKNLKYIIITRAEKELIYIKSPK